MAKFLFVAQGAGGTPIELPVIVDTPNIVLNGLETKSVRFTIENTLARQIVFTAVNILKEGPAKDKVNAVVRFDNIVIEPAAIFENFLDVESVQAVFENETFTITVSAEEGTV